VSGEGPLARLGRQGAVVQGVVERPQVGRLGRREGPAAELARRADQGPPPPRAEQRGQPRAPAPGRRSVL